MRKYANRAELDALSDDELQTRYESVLAEQLNELSDEELNSRYETAKQEQQGERYSADREDKPLDDKAWLVNFVKEQESFTPKSFWDRKQFTNGYGTPAKFEGEEIDKPTANARLTERLSQDRQKVVDYTKRTGYNFSNNQIDALTSFVYNTGIGSINTLTDNGKRSEEEIAAWLTQYNKARNKTGQLEEVPGLTKRRRAELDHFRDGIGTKAEVSDLDYYRSLSDKDFAAVYAQTELDIANNQVPEQSVEEIVNQSDETLGLLKPREVRAQLATLKKNLQGTRTDPHIGIIEKAFERGLSNVQANLAGGVAAIGHTLGIDAVATWGDEARLEAMLDAAQYQKVYRGLEKEVTNAYSAGMWFLESIAENIPTMVPSMLGGGLGAAYVKGVGKKVLSRFERMHGADKTKQLLKHTRSKRQAAAFTTATAFNWPQLTGEMYTEQLNEGIPKDKAGPRALAAGLPAALLDTAPMMMGFNRLAKLAKTTPKGVKDILTRTAKEGLKGIATEVPTEVMQTLIGKALVYAEKAHNTYDIFSEENLAELRETAYVAAATGGAMRAAPTAALTTAQVAVDKTIAGVNKIIGKLINDPTYTKYYKEGQAKAAHDEFKATIDGLEQTLAERQKTDPNADFTEEELQSMGQAIVYGINAWKQSEIARIDPEMHTLGLKYFEIIRSKYGQQLENAMGSERSRILREIASNVEKSFGDLEQQYKIFADDNKTTEEKKAAVGKISNNINKRATRVFKGKLSQTQNMWAGVQNWWNKRNKSDSMVGEDSSFEEKNVAMKTFLMKERKWSPEEAEAGAVAAATYSRDLAELRSSLSAEEFEAQLNSGQIALPTMTDVTQRVYDAIHENLGAKKQLTDIFPFGEAPADSNIEILRRDDGQVSQAFKADNRQGISVPSEEARAELARLQKEYPEHEFELAQVEDLNTVDHAQVAALQAAINDSAPLTSTQIQALYDELEVAKDGEKPSTSVFDAERGHVIIAYPSENGLSVHETQLVKEAEHYGTEAVPIPDTITNVNKRHKWSDRVFTILGVSYDAPTITELGLRKVLADRTYYRGGIAKNPEMGRVNAVQAFEGFIEGLGILGKIHNFTVAEALGEDYATLSNDTPFTLKFPKTTMPDVIVYTYGDSAELPYLTFEKARQLTYKRFASTVTNTKARFSKVGTIELVDIVWDPILRQTDPTYIEEARLTVLTRYREELVALQAQQVGDYELFMLDPNLDPVSKDFIAKLKESSPEQIAKHLYKHYRRKESYSEYDKMFRTPDERIKNSKKAIEDILVELQARAIELGFEGALNSPVRVKAFLPNIENTKAETLAEYAVLYRDTAPEKAEFASLVIEYRKRKKEAQELPKLSSTRDGLLHYYATQLRIEYLDKQVENYSALYDPEDRQDEAWTAGISAINEVQNQLLNVEDFDFITDPTTDEIQQRLRPLDVGELSKKNLTERVTFPYQMKPAHDVTATSPVTASISGYPNTLTDPTYIKYTLEAIEKRLATLPTAISMSSTPANVQQRKTQAQGPRISTPHIPDNTKHPLYKYNVVIKKLIEDIKKYASQEAELRSEIGSLIPKIHVAGTKALKNETPDTQVTDLQNYLELEGELTDKLDQLRHLRLIHLDAINYVESIHNMKILDQVTKMQMEAGAVYQFDEIVRTQHAKRSRDPRTQGSTFYVGGPKEIENPETSYTIEVLLDSVNSAIEDGVDTFVTRWVDGILRLTNLTQSPDVAIKAISKIREGGIKPITHRKKLPYHDMQLSIRELMATKKSLLRRIRDTDYKSDRNVIEDDLSELEITLEGELKLLRTLISKDKIHAENARSGKTDSEDAGIARFGATDDEEPDNSVQPADTHMDAAMQAGGGSGGNVNRITWDSMIMDLKAFFKVDPMSPDVDSNIQPPKNVKVRQISKYLKSITGVTDESARIGTFIGMLLHKVNINSAKATYVDRQGLANLIDKPGRTSLSYWTVADISTTPLKTEDPRLSNTVLKSNILHNIDATIKRLEQIIVAGMPPNPNKPPVERTPANAKTWADIHGELKLLKTEVVGNTNWDRHENRDTINQMRTLRQRAADLGILVKNHRLYTPEQLAELQAAFDSSDKGRTIYLRDHVVLYVNTTAATPKGVGISKRVQNTLTAAHEVGHMYMRGVFGGMNPEYLAELRTAYRKDITSILIENPDSELHLMTFKEWFADQFAGWMISEGVVLKEDMTVKDYASLMKQLTIDELRGSTLFPKDETPDMSNVPIVGAESYNINPAVNRSRMAAIATENKNILNSLNEIVQGLKSIYKKAINLTNRKFEVNHTFGNFMRDMIVSNGRRAHTSSGISKSMYIHGRPFMPFSGFSERNTIETYETLTPTIDMLAIQAEELSNETNEETTTTPQEPTDEQVAEQVKQPYYKNIDAEKMKNQAQGWWAQAKRVVLPLMSAAIQLRATTMDPDIVDMFWQSPQKRVNKNLKKGSWFNNVAYQLGYWGQMYEDALPKGDKIARNEALTLMQDEAIADEDLPAHVQKLRAIHRKYVGYLRSKDPSYNVEDNRMPRLLNLPRINTDRAAWATFLRDKAKITQQEEIDELTHALLDGSMALGTERALAIAPPSKGAMGFVGKLSTLPTALLQKEGWLHTDPEVVLFTALSKSIRAVEFGDVFGLHDAYTNTFNPIGLLEKRLGEISDIAKRNRAEVIIQGIMGQRGANMDPKLRNIQNNIMAYENWLLLAFTAVASIPELAGPILRAKDIDGAARALHEYVAVVKNRKEAIARYKAMGFLEETLAHQAMMAVYGLDPDPSWAQKANKALFFYNGNKFFIDMTRVFAAKVGEDFILRHADIAQGKSDKKAESIRYLEELGLKASDVKTWQDLGQPIAHRDADLNINLDQDEATKQYAERIQRALRIFIDQSLVHPNNTMRPVFMSDHRFALLTHLKTFFYAYQHTVLSGIWNNMQERKGLQKSVPLLIAAFLLMPLAAISIELRELIKYGGQKDPTKNMNPMEYLNKLLTTAGGYGQLEIAMHAAASRDRGGSTLAALGGPTVGHFHQLFFGTHRDAFVRSTPLVSQIPLIRPGSEYFPTAMNER